MPDSLAKFKFRMLKMCSSAGDWVHVGTLDLGSVHSVHSQFSPLPFSFFSSNSCLIWLSSRSMAIDGLLTWVIKNLLPLITSIPIIYFIYFFIFLIFAQFLLCFLLFSSFLHYGLDVADGPDPDPLCCYHPPPHPPLSSAHLLSHRYFSFDKEIQSWD